MANKVKPVPDGYHTVTPSMAVADAAKAIEFYKQALGAEELMRVAGPGGKIMHAEIRVGNSAIMLNDEMPEMGSKGPKSYGGTPVGFYVYVENLDAAWKRATDAGVKVTMPPAEMFWGDRLGAFEDPFGHRWTLAQHVKDPTPEEMRKGQEAFAKGGPPNA